MDEESLTFLLFPITKLIASLPKVSKVGKNGASYDHMILFYLSTLLFVGIVPYVKVRIANRYLGIV